MFQDLILVEQSYLNLQDFLLLTGGNRPNISQSIIRSMIEASGTPASEDWQLFWQIEPGRINSRLFWFKYDTKITDNGRRGLLFPPEIDIFCSSVYSFQTRMYKKRPYDWLRREWSGKSTKLWLKRDSTTCYLSSYTIRESAITDQDLLRYLYPSIFQNQLLP